jgi:hypothetical protein
MNRHDLIEINKNIYKSIDSYSNRSDIKINKQKNLKKIQLLVSKNWFQSMFSNFCKFYSAANKKHPDFHFLINDIFSEKIIEKSLDINKTNEFIKKNNITIHDAFNNSIKKFFTEEEVRKINYYNDPEENRTATRFLDYQKKWNTRKTKRDQVILKETNSKISYDLNKSILSICHNSKSIFEYIRNLNQKKQSLLEINCIQLAAEIDEYLLKIKENINLSRHGFFRVSISKLLDLASSLFEYRGAEIFPIKDKDYLSQFPIPNFIDLCDNYFGKNLSIFDHYAHVKFVGGPFSFLIGEIDSKSYFVGLIHE